MYKIRHILERAQRGQGSIRLAKRVTVTVHSHYFTQAVESQWVALNSHPLPRSCNRASYRKLDALFSWFVHESFIFSFSFFIFDIRQDNYIYNYLILLLFNLIEPLFMLIVNVTGD